MNTRLNFFGPILVFGGIYSNLQALRALLDYARDEGFAPSSMICTGDIVAYGADARACVDLVRTLEIPCIAGNCEEQLAADALDCGCGYAPGSVCDTLAVRWYAHASGTLDAGDRAWMAALPRRLDIAINGLSLTVVHGALNASNRFVYPSTQMRIKSRDIEKSGSDGILAGHSGLPFSQIAGGRLWHNSGALGMPANDGTPRVWFSKLSPGREPRSLIVEHIALEYDMDGAAGAMRAAALPEDYALALTSGLWPSCESLPAEEMKITGKPLIPGRIRWAAGSSASAQWPQITGPQKAMPQQVLPDEVLPAPVPTPKFQNPDRTAAGEPRAGVTLESLDTLWINTGTLCNLACASCYIESTPRNDRLVYISASEVAAYLDEIGSGGLGTKTIGFTGGEPFLNPDMATMMEDALTRGFEVIVLTNAMKPMRRFERRLADLNARFRDRLVMRVSIDHYAKDLHELERGPRSWRPAIDGLKWLAANDFRINIAGRLYSGEADGIVRAGYAQMLAALGVDVNVADPAELVLFPEMDPAKDVPEITTACWDILGKSPTDVMCSNSRMVVKRKGAERPVVVACTLLAYDERFELGATLADSRKFVPLNHAFCAQFCVLGGAACKR